MNWTASMLMETSDCGHDQPPAARTFLLLSSLAAGADPDDVWSTGLGPTNVLLLDACHSALGISKLDAAAECPQCGSALEASFTVADLREGLSRGARECEVHGVRSGQYLVSVRDVTLGDLRVASDLRDLASARAVLFERCILSAERSGVAVPVDSLPEDILLAVSNHLGEHDQSGDPRVGMTCVGCSRQFERGLDLIGHAWVALETAADKLQREVAALARGFGWTESEVLALSTRRRESYLKILEGLG
jgi:hypothetical protein